MSYFLEVSELEKVIGRKRIVTDINFTVKKGEIFGLLGPNGAGKTTILKMILGLSKFSSGTICVKGVDIRTNFQTCLQEMGAIIETPRFYTYMTGYDNLKYYSMYHAGVTEARILEAAQLIGIEDALFTKVKNYSLGMCQRLGIAQAILHDPAVLILDEPTNGLDPQGIYDLRKYLKQLAGQGKSIVISSHLLSELESICDKVAFINRGRLISINQMEEIRNQKLVNEVEFITSDVSRTFHLLQKHLSKTYLKIINQTVQSKILVKDIPNINKILVQNDIDVYAINVKSPSLEDYYMDLLKTEGGGETGHELIEGRAI
jgi:ABC-2 type transport system ATP-binding protein